MVAAGSRSRVNFGPWLKAIREGAGVSVDDLATAFGVSRGALLDAESGGPHPSVFLCDYSKAAALLLGARANPSSTTKLRAEMYRIVDDDKKAQIGKHKIKKPRDGGDR